MKENIDLTLSWTELNLILKALIGAKAHAQILHHEKTEQEYAELIETFHGIMGLSDAHPLATA